MGQMNSSAKIDKSTTIPEVEKYLKTIAGVTISDVSFLDKENGAAEIHLEYAGRIECEGSRRRVIYVNSHARASINYLYVDIPTFENDHLGPALMRKLAYFFGGELYIDSENDTPDEVYAGFSASRKAAYLLSASSSTVDTLPFSFSKGLIQYTFSLGGVVQHRIIIKYLETDYDNDTVVFQTVDSNLEVSLSRKLLERGKIITKETLTNGFQVESVSTVEPYNQ